MQNINETSNTTESETAKDVKKTPTEILEALRTSFEKEVISWTNDITVVTSKISGHIESINEAQSLALSYRQKLIESVGNYSRRLVKQNNILKTLKKGKFIYYSTGLLPDGNRPSPDIIRRDQHIVSLKKTKSEMDIIISGDLTDSEQYTELLESHIFFLRECVKTVDHCLYSIKNRIELMNLMLNIQ